MRALTYHGKHDVRVDTVPDPEIVNPRDAIIEVTATAICGSDLHLYDGVIPGVMAGDILGHEFMGRVVDTGPDSTLQKGQRVVVPFTISCGQCFHCMKHQYSACDNSNPAEKQDLTEPLYGQALSGLFGYSHLTGGYPGGQAEYVRVPFSDVGPIVIPDGLDDEQVLFLSDILPTGWQAAVNADVGPGSTVAVWGAGPVGQFAVKSAFLLGAERVFAIDRVPERLALAQDAGAEIIDESEAKVFDALHERTAGRLPECVIDAVGLEAHGAGLLQGVYDTVKTATYQETDRPSALREAIMCCRKGGTVSIPGVYAGMIDKFPMGAAFGKALSFKMGQTHVLKHLPELMRRIEAGEIDPSEIITHRGTLDEAPGLYRTFRDKKDDCIKVVLRPH
jgi:threonine dehydrogenase-like Zn-dependent dehydrogenase